MLYNHNPQQASKLSKPAAITADPVLVCVCVCRNHGCNKLQCVLCKHNPNKRCTGNFAHKYWVGDKLLAKCEGEIQVEMVDGATGERVVEDMSSMRLEVQTHRLPCVRAHLGICSMWHACRPLLSACKALVQSMRPAAMHAAVCLCMHSDAGLDLQDSWQCTVKYRAASRAMMWFRIAEH